MVVATEVAAGVRGGSLASHGRDFAAHPTPWAIGGFIAAFVGARSLLGPLRWSDLAAFAAIVAIEPFFEWVVHSQILHATPMKVLGRPVELSAAKGHRLHHEDPTNLELVFVPRWVLLYVGPGLTLAGFGLIRPAHLAATALAASAAGLLVYEWTHYLIHSSYRPRRRAFRRQWRHHRLHHYRNEGYWFGIMTPVSDMVLGTSPRAADIAVSPTAHPRAAAPAQEMKSPR